MSGYFLKTPTLEKKVTIIATLLNFAFFAIAFSLLNMGQILYQKSFET